MTKMKKFLIVFTAFCCLCMAVSIGHSLSVKERLQVPEESIVDIEDSVSFFQNMPGVFYLYFGQDSSPLSVEFEAILEEALQKNTWTVYRFDTAYWTKAVAYEKILEKYHVTKVPTLVKVVDGEWESSFTCDSQDKAQILAALDSFFIPRQDGLLSVTADRGYRGANYPIQFHHRIMALTFLGMLVPAVYLVSHQAALTEQRKKHLALLAGATLLFVFHLWVAKQSFQFVWQYDALPDLSWLGILGKATWITVTPALYFLIATLSIRIRSGRERQLAEA